METSRAGAPLGLCMGADRIGSVSGLISGHRLMLWMIRNDTNVNLGPFRDIGSVWHPHQEPIWVYPTPTEPWLWI